MVTDPSTGVLLVYRLGGRCAPQRRCQRGRGRGHRGRIERRWIRVTSRDCQRQRERRGRGRRRSRPEIRGYWRQRRSRRYRGRIERRGIRVIGASSGIHGHHSVGHECGRGRGGGRRVTLTPEQCEERHLSGPGIAIVHLVKAHTTMSRYSNSPSPESTNWWSILRGLR